MESESKSIFFMERAVSCECLGDNVRVFRSPNCILGNAFKYLQAAFVLYCFAPGWCAVNNTTHPYSKITQTAVERLELQDTNYNVVVT